MSARLEAAQSIADVLLRGQSLAQLATDAADAGDSEIVMESLQGIGDIHQRDGAAVSAALKLGKAGKGSDAVMVAKTVLDLSTRDRVMAKLAKGEYGE